ncbi:alpha-1-antitrypsin-like [Dendrobates tinctorius]|uniref:alpha-1-antitrypsin-like n=1 Tax=Dendrobates tinctorius TaxID=92724 RepID=UPI003CC98700
MPAVDDRLAVMKQNRESLRNRYLLHRRDTKDQPIGSGALHPCLRNMRVFLFLGGVLLFTLALADHHEGDNHDKDDHHDHKDDHEKKEDHHIKEHHNHNESMPCHKIAQYNSKFSFNLYRQVTLDHPSENIVFSPVSVSTAFAFLSLGAKAQTHSQIIEGIGFNTSEISEQQIHEGFHHLLVLLNDVNRELQLRGGNALFISQEHKILQTFLDEANNLYLSEAFSIDFKNNEEAKNHINSYVEKNTHGKIAELLDSVDKDAIFVLINYIYFKAKWEKPFEKKWTTEGDFHINENKTVKVLFMKRTGFYKVAITDEATVVSIPYKGDAGALLILPEMGKLSEMEQNLNTISVYKFKNLLRRRLVNLHLPTFSITGTVNLKEMLSKMGVVDVFSDNADLSGITSGANIKISKAVHKAVLNVNEHGTEAAGVTALEVVPMMLPTQVKYNRPFIFIVYDLKAKSVIFIGRVLNPKE